jgi:hypothetical protein
MADAPRTVYVHGASVSTASQAGAARRANGTRIGIAM